ncbi:MAG: signal peptidase II [bacterium]
MEDAANRPSTLRVFWLWIGLIIALDQIAKVLAIVYLKHDSPFNVLPGLFNLCYVENRGAAWGVLAGSQTFLISFSLITLAFLFWKRTTLFGALWGGSFIFTLLIAGIVGNLTDRIRLGYVVDFLDFYWGRSHFPAFNVADSAICVATILLILSQWVHDRHNAGATQVKASEAGSQ